MIPNLSDTICAIASAPGMGAIAVVRLSGSASHNIIAEIFRPMSPKSVAFDRIEESTTNTAKSKVYKTADQNSDHHPRMRHSYYGEILDNGSVLDDAVVVLYKNPESYTGEDASEINCHGSLFIQNRLLQLLIEKGARMAEPGEFSLRAFVNGKIDLLQAEAIDDIIRSRTGTAHNLAMKQMRGDYSKKLSELRVQLVYLTALMELEIDFSEEDVEFADRATLRQTCDLLMNEVSILANSFKAGNVLKHGIPVAIVGEPNVGKSTLLNKILREERSIVSEIPGTTRDFIEDTLTVGNTTFRFIDTAGLRNTTDSIESAGVERTLVKASESSIILLLFDAADCEEDRIQNGIETLKNQIENFEDKKLIVVINKIDLLVNAPRHMRELLNYDVVFISAKRNENLEELMNKLTEVMSVSKNTPDIVLTNIRHYEAFMAIASLLQEAIEHIDSRMPQDLTASFLHQALHHIGLITGTVSNEDVLDSIFRNFCIGK